MKHFFKSSGTIVAYIASVILLFLYFAFADKWTALGDGEYYWAMAEGKITIPPFCYRIVTAGIARILPWDLWTNFKFVSFNCLALTSSILVLNSRHLGYSRFRSFMVFFFWISSYAFVYYGTTIVRADASMFLLMAVVLYLSNIRAHPIALAISCSLATLAHEMGLIILLVLFLDKLCEGKLSGASKYRYPQLLLIGVLSLLITFEIRKHTDHTTSDMLNYLNSPVGTAKYVLEYSGGLIRHFLRIFASFGPVFLMSAYHLLCHYKGKEILGLTTLFAAVVAASFLAADTLRVAAIFSFPVFIIGAEFLETLKDGGKMKLLVTFIVLQVAYSVIVFGHLKTFESSPKLQLMTMAISILAFLLCLIDFSKGPQSKLLKARFFKSLKWRVEAGPSG